ncbi:MAG: hypothetical protein KA604_03590 [Candidatus Saccharimonas sp.]|nr:hypothetical protein [Candidatus Saccharimonas sp.]
MKLFRKKQSSVPGRRRQSSDEVAHRVTGAELDQRYNFRRNRTLTGSLSSDVQSAKIHNMELRSSRVQSHDLRSHRRRLGLMLLIVMACVSGLSYLIYQFIAVPVVMVDGVTLRSSDAKMYEDKVQKYLMSHPVQRVRAVLDADELTAYLQNNGAPEVGLVRQSAAFVNVGKSRFTLEMRQPAVMWRTGSHTYYVDIGGNAFERNYASRPAVEVVDETGIQANDNLVLASDRFLGFIGKIIGQMKVQGYEVVQVTLPANTSRQVAVKVANVQYPIKFTVDRPAGEQAEDAARAIRYLQAKGVTPQYLDARVGGKAFYL